MVTGELIQAFIGGGPWGYVEVDGDGDRLEWRQFMSGQDLAPRIEAAEPTTEDWRRFWRSLDRIGVWDWRGNYDARDLVCDGTHWSVVVERDGRRIEAAGENAYPGSEGLDPSREFEAFCRAVSRLVGGREFS